MKNIKNFAFAAMIAVAGTSSLFMTSCKKDDDGCPSGYIGSKCDSTFSDKYLGNYNVTETENGTPNPPAFSCSITKASSTPATTIVISNFGNSGVAVPATVNNSGNITLQSTTVGSRTITGSGLLTGTSIQITYAISGDNSVYVNTFTRL
jgi:hypothetical protein